MRKPLTLALIALTAVACGGPGDVIATAPTTTTAPSLTTSTLPSGTEGTTTTTAFDNPPMLLVLGDWGSGTQPQGAVAGAMARLGESNDFEAILTTGDNFYSDDAEFIMTPYDWVENSGIEWWITWGNHDDESASRRQAVSDTFDSPPRWTTHQWGRVTVVILDSNQVSDDGQIEFLDATLADIEGPKIVVFHHPAYSCSRHGDTASVKEQWVPRFDSNVVLVLSGHDHNYQRIEQGDATYVVTGGGGRRLYAIEPCEHDVVASAELHHFVVLDQNSAVIQGTAVDVNGNPFDEFFIDLEPGVLED